MRPRAPVGRVGRALPPTPPGAARPSFLPACFPLPRGRRPGSGAQPPRVSAQAPGRPRAVAGLTPPSAPPARPQAPARTGCRHGDGARPPQAKPRPRAATCAPRRGLYPARRLRRFGPAAPALPGGRPRPGSLLLASRPHPHPGRTVAAAESRANARHLAARGPSSLTCLFIFFLYFLPLYFFK